ncbi:hypothetical protein [Ligilactobacillus salivarius]|uniref:Uncharacterized protein n=1 Tax=Ligilactobacillus salivarius TaxID=1624 RepID=A0AAW6Q0T8_9LACO|nr:hypothetical protein [Ligilactobacillus salivarius]MDF4186545.1 hypothetical protein [Ligilactobacillus salivarius]
MEDQGTKFKLYFKANKIVAVPDTPYIYRKRSGSIMNPTEELLEDRIRRYGERARNLTVLC